MSRPHNTSSYLHDDGSSDHVVHGPVVKRILDVQVKVLLVRADGTDQLGDVVGVQCAGLCGQTAGQVAVANVSHALRDKKLKLGDVALHWKGRAVSPRDLNCSKTLKRIFYPFSHLDFSSCTPVEQTQYD